MCAELFKHDLIFEYCKDKSVLHVGACDYPYHIERAETGQLLHLKLEKIASQLIGIDNNRQAIHELETIGVSNIYFGDIVKGVYEIDLDKFHFDVILFADVIEHLNNPGIALAHIKQLMNKHTKLIVTTPNVFKIGNLKTLITGKENVHPDHKFWPSYKTMKTLFNQAGFEIERFSYCLSGEYFKITKKGKAFYKLVYKRIPHIMPVLFFVLTLKE